MRKINLPFLASLVLVAGALSIGCTRADRYRLNPTPELSHLGETRGQVSNNRARIQDNMGRAAWDDFDRLMLMDDNSRLQPTPTP